MGSPQLHSNTFSSRVAILPRPTLPGRGGAGSPNRRPGYPVRRSGDDGHRLRYVPTYGLGLPYGVAVWPGYLDSGYYNGSAYADSAYATQPAAADYAPEPYPAPPAEQAEAVRASQYRPTYQRPQPEPEPEDPVTLVFKDGRPTEQIHDYIITRTILYVQDTYTREIPLADLDLTAMDKVNKAAGVHFQLPANR